MAHACINLGQLIDDFGSWKIIMYLVKTYLKNKVFSFSFTDINRSEK